MKDEVVLVVLPREVWPYGRIILAFDRATAEALVAEYAKDRREEAA